MIELFDAARLSPRRDRSVALLGIGLAAVLLTLGGWTARLQMQLNAESLAQAEVSARLQAAQSAQAADSGSAHPTSALLADLQRQIAMFEAESGGADTANQTYSSPSASQWLDRLDLLAAADCSLQKIEVDRAGSARLEGLARSPQAVSRLVQAWDHQQQPQSPVPARAVELRQNTPTELHFMLRATAPAPRS